MSSVLKKMILLLISASFVLVPAINAKNSKLSKTDRKKIANIIRQNSLKADWPISINWRLKIKKNKQERTRLASIYEAMWKSPEMRYRWYPMIQWGLLKMNLGSRYKVFRQWSINLKRNPNGPLAEKVAGFLIEIYNEKKEWRYLEQISIICIQNKIKPRTLSNKKLDPRKSLIKANSYLKKKTFT